MASATLNVPLTNELLSYVEDRVDGGSFGTPAEYIRELIRNERDRRLAHLEERLLESLKSKPVRFSRDELGHGNFVDLCRTKLQEAK